jgi:hypothetical protein
MFDPLKAYKRGLTDPEQKKKYDEGYDRIFGRKEKQHGLQKKEKEER